MVSLDTGRRGPGLLERKTGRKTRLSGKSLRYARAVDGDAAEIDRVDLARVGDVVERVSVEHKQISVLPRFDRAAVAHAQEFGTVARRCRDHLRRRHPGGH